MIFSSNFVSLFRLTRLSLRLRCLVGLTFLPMTGLMVSFPRCGDEPWGQRRWLTDIFWNRVLKKISTLLEQIACLIPVNNFFSVPTLSQSINTQKNKQGQYSVILTFSVDKGFTIWYKEHQNDLWENFSRRTQRLILNGKGGAILPSGVDNQRRIWLTLHAYAIYGAYNYSTFLTWLFVSGKLDE